MTDRVTDAITEFAPNFKRSVLARDILLPVDLEARYGLDHYRRERLRSRPGTVDPPREFADDDPEADQVARDRVRLFAGIFRSLSQDCRRLLRWMYDEGLSAAEAGVRLGLTANNVRVRAHRCMERARVLARAAQAGGAGGPA